MQTEQLVSALDEIDSQFRMAEWSKDRAAIMRRNRSIAARNRFFAEWGPVLGMNVKPLELLPVPTVERTP